MSNWDQGKISKIKLLLGIAISLAIFVLFLYKLFKPGLG